MNVSVALTDLVGFFSGGRDFLKERAGALTDNFGLGAKGAAELDGGGYAIEPFPYRREIANNQIESGFVGTIVCVLEKNYRRGRTGANQRKSVTAHQLMRFGHNDRSELAIAVESRMEMGKSEAGVDGIPCTAQHNDSIAVITSEVKNSVCHLGVCL